jgi:alpha-L-fucosidase 2
MDPPWQSKYTLNINIEMIYWPAGPANLIECFEPIFDLISDISQTGQITAQRHYGTVRSFSLSAFDAYQMMIVIDTRGQLGMSS